MPFPYKHVLLIGATSGIGKAMADKLILEGVKVTVVGRRGNRLDEFVKKHGPGKASSAKFDIGKIEEIPRFAADVTRRLPGIDCVFLNAGIQGWYNMNSPDIVDLSAFNNEISVNFTSFTNLAISLLPFLKSQKSQTGLIFTTSTLAIVPAVSMPAYSASKAALGAFILCLRAQLQETNVKVVELLPPPVQTELHDKQMGEEAGRKFGMPVDEFTDIAYKRLADGEDQVIIGTIGPGKGYDYERFHGIVDGRRTAFEWLSDLMLGRAKV